MAKENLLLTPGPTCVPPDVLQVMAQPIFHHRTPQYRKLFEKVSTDLKAVFRTAQPVYTFTGSGTLAMEAAVVNFCSPGDEVIVLEAGKFGERWRSIAERYQIKALSLSAPYGSVVPLENLERALKEHPKAKAVYGTLCETSTGTLFDVEAIARLIRKTEAIFVVDAISGLVADRLEMDLWGIDVVVCGSQKGLMLPPGLSFLAVSQKAWKLVPSAKCPRFYTSLQQADAALKQSDTAFTPALTLVLGLKLVLDKLLKEGLEHVWQRTEGLARKTRSSIQKRGLTLFSQHPSNAVTAVNVPPGIDGKKLVSIMRDEKGVTIAGGQGEMTGKIFRIAHFGFVSEADIEKGIEMLTETLEELKTNSVSRAGS
ncbi:MAG: hypothetical protein A3A73_05490 [Omnitrophica bacterium RIFCSPLOWO2_01_FULL_50_24]|nr:MAG: hypothetical protein A3A73_05490 [Omnitrophica bacterium RIFCSPLOWO2_01_FULL_50_24]